LCEQHDRWLEELLEYTSRKEAVTCSSGYMPLTAITQEIVTACADSRPHSGQQIASWQSMAGDLSDTLDWIGPDLLALVDAPARAVHRAITNDLLAPGTNGRPRLDDSQRPLVGAAASALATILDGDDVLVAAWHDLVAACRDIDHVRYPSERIAFLRDTLVGLSEHRRQDRGYFSPISTAVQVLVGKQTSVQQAQAMVGDAVDKLTPRDPDATSALTEDERADLAARCILERPKADRYWVWFRLSPGYFGKDPCVTHGNITFYEAQALASALTDHDRAREAFEVVPEELLTDEIRDLQRSGKVNDHTGFEYEPGLVYARVTVDDVESPSAMETARMQLDTVLAVVGVHEHMWKVLGGYLVFDDSPWNPFGAGWGLKEALPEPVFYQNDHFVTDLGEMTANGHVITADTARRLQPALRLLSALTDTARADSEAIVMAAVRAIEHSNTWIAPTGGLHWNAFIDDYLLDEYTLTAFAKRVVLDVFAAAEQYRPDHTPGAKYPPELEAIRQDIIMNGWGTRIDSAKTPPHVAALRRVYADHWLVRRLAETDDILSSGTALSAAFDEERRRVNARIKRLTRSRNSAIHGGPLSDAACSTIADCATRLARQALTTTIWATVTGRPADTHATTRRDEHRQRIQKLTQGGDLANLFSLTP
jgi:hypothetical protein